MSPKSPFTLLPHQCSYLLRTKARVTAHGRNWKDPEVPGHHVGRISWSTRGFRSVFSHRSMRAFGGNASLPLREHCETLVPLTFRHQCKERPQVLATMHNAETPFHVPPRELVRTQFSWAENSQITCGCKERYRDLATQATIWELAHSRY